MGAQDGQAGPLVGRRARALDRRARQQSTLSAASGGRRPPESHSGRIFAGAPAYASLTAGRPATRKHAHMLGLHAAGANYDCVAGSRNE
jgi:hypothetical protein